MTDLQAARLIAERVAALGGQVYFVGGCVRDELLGRESKDIDIEVHGIAPSLLENVLDEVGRRLSFGRSFGIYNLKGLTLDIALPRGEARDEPDPFVGEYKAALRRDFTINALMKNVLTGVVLDFFGGRRDLESGIIRHVSERSFVEDRLRVLRAAQFAARLGFSLAPETRYLCASLEISDLPCERVEAELKKALLKSERPSVFFETLRSFGALGYWFEELEALIGIAQNRTHHAEGDAYTHTMMVLDEAAKLRGRVQNPYGFMLAALTHDFGKAVCTEEIDGVVHAYAHETEGLPLVERFMKRLTNERELRALVLNLTELHMKPNVVAGARSSVKKTNKMFDDCLDPMALICLSIADGKGKIAEYGYVSNEAFLLERLETYREYMARPYVAGRDLIEAGLSQCSQFSELLSYAHKLHLAGVSKENALRQTLAYARKQFGITPER